MKKIISTILGGILLTLSLTAPAAEAHETATYAYHGKDYAYVGGDTGKGAVYDKECDGHAVRVVLYGKKFGRYVTDANGCEPGGTVYDYGSDIIDGMRVEERNDNGDWVPGTAVQVHDH